MIHALHTIRRYSPLLILVVINLFVLSCSTAQSTPTVTTPSEKPTGTTEPAATATTVPATATATATEVLPTPNLPTATPYSPPEPGDGRYENPEAGISFAYPDTWDAAPGQDDTTLLQLFNPPGTVGITVFHASLPADMTLEEAAATFREASTRGADDVENVSEDTRTVAGEYDAIVHQYDVTYDSDTIRARLITIGYRQRVVVVMAYGAEEILAEAGDSVASLVDSLEFTAPAVNGIPRDQALFFSAGESTNPRVYDPATGRGMPYTFSGLVTFTPDLEVVPDLAESWDVSADGTVYTFHLRENARFHDGRPVTAADVIYSWERAAHPETDSDTVLTYLGDIVGVEAMHAGDADHIEGLKALDDHTLQVTFDAAKPYVLAKLTQHVAYVVDRANVESGDDWYRTPNGTGPYRLIRWDSFEQRLFERNEEFYGEPPAVRFIVEELYAGSSLQLFETGSIDVAGVSARDVQRLRDPSEPLHTQLRERVGLCTQMVGFDTTRPPFDDPAVRDAFSLAIDRERYVDIAMHGAGVPAQGLYPPGLPGYNADLDAGRFDPERARTRLSESQYAGTDALSSIVLTSSGFGSNVDPGVSVLIDMWQRHLDISITVENLEPNRAIDMMYDGYHGQLFYWTWCADYPDPENFADTLFHSGAEQNFGGYTNVEFDTLVERARTVQDTESRIEMYKDAEQMLVDDRAAIFLAHNKMYALVKPRVEGFELTPIGVPLERYVSLSDTP